MASVGVTLPYKPNSAVVVVRLPNRNVAVFSFTFTPASVGSVDMANVVPVPVCEAIDVVLPTDVIGPVKFAFVVTVAALPVMFV